MSKKDLIEQNITRVQEYVRELIEDAKWNNGVSETLESTSIIVGNFCSMVFRLMDTEEYNNNYCKSLDLVLKLFPEIDGELLEKELDRYI